MALSRKWRRYRGWIAVATLVLVAAAVLWAYQANQEAPAATTYTTETAEAGTLSVTVDGTGNLEVRDLVEVSPESAGTIATVEVKEGDAVSAGDILYTLDADDAQDAIAKAYLSYLQAQESVTRASNTLYRAQVALAELQDKRTEQVSSPSTSTALQDSVSSADVAAAKRDITSAKQGLTSANANLAIAKAAWEEAKAAEDDLAVTAPVAGIVWAVNSEVGDSAGASSGGSGSSASVSAAAATTTNSSSSGSAPVSIARDGELGLSLSVNEVDLPAIEVGQRVDIAFDALPDLSMTGKVAEIGTEGTIDQGVVSYDVWISLDADNDALRPGMSASATIVTEVARNVLLVPNSAVKDGDDGSYVEVLDQGASAPRQVSVTTGLEGASQTVIESGIEAGTRVVTKTTDASDEEDSSGGMGGGAMMPPMGGGR